MIITKLIINDKHDRSHSRNDEKVSVRNPSLCILGRPAELARARRARRLARAAMLR